MTSVDSGVETGNDSNDGAVQLSDNQINQSFMDNSPSTTLHCVSLPTNKQELELLETNYNNFGNDKKLCLIASSSLDTAKSIRFDFDMSTFTNLELPFKYPPEFVSPSTAVTETDCLSKRHVHSRGRIKKYFITPWQRRLTVAASTNNIEMLKSVLKKGASPNGPDEFQRTPLHLASCRGYTEIVKILLDYGANPNLVDCLNNTPLHLAAVTCKIEVITLLLKAGADVLSLDRHGYNPLQLAQSKLRMLQNCPGSDMALIKEEVNKIISMLLAYLHKQKDHNLCIEELSSFCSKISLSNDTDQVQGDLKELLASIEALSLKSDT